MSAFRQRLSRTGKNKRGQNLRRRRIEKETEENIWRSIFPLRRRRNTEKEKIWIKENIFLCGKDENILRIRISFLRRRRKRRKIFGE